MNIVDNERHKKSMANIKAEKLGYQVRIHEIIIGFTVYGRRLTTRKRWMNSLEK